MELKKKSFKRPEHQGSKTQITRTLSKNRWDAHTCKHLGDGRISHTLPLNLSWEKSEADSMSDCKTVRGCARQGSVCFEKVALTGRMQLSAENDHWKLFFNLVLLSDRRDFSWQKRFHLSWPEHTGIVHDSSLCATRARFVHDSATYWKELLREARFLLENFFPPFGCLGYHNFHFGNIWMEQWSNFTKNENMIIYNIFNQWVKFGPAIFSWVL